MGREFAQKTWIYTNDLKEKSGKKAYEQKQEIKDNGSAAINKYKNHKYKADVKEAVNDGMYDYCKSINETTSELKTTLNEDAGLMATNFKTEATDVKAMLPQGKNQVKQNILQIGLEGGKQFAAVDKDILPTLRKEMYAVEKQLYQERKKALGELRKVWQQSRNGLLQQQTALQNELRKSEKQPKSHTQ